ncbi:MAG: hypothetical protein IKG89_06815 [Oscillospiraceae bacterium]|nr:hypothetical protein [Oscillospiraceae bacterium]
MGVLRFDRWCSLAVSGIRFKPDRKEIYEELYAHMEDQYEELTAAGFSEKEAEEEVAAAMGDPAETSRQLARIHRPFWGYALRAARVCLILSAILALITFVPRCVTYLKEQSADEEKKYLEDARMADSLDRLVWHCQPMSRDRSDGYTFTLTDAALRSYSNFVDSSFDRDYLLLRVEVFNIRPWAMLYGVHQEFYAVDSLGNVYTADNRTRNHRLPCVMGSVTKTGFFAWTWELRLNGFCSWEAEWLELRYDQCGRDVRLYLDLREGEEG